MWEKGDRVVLRAEAAFPTAKQFVVTKTRQRRSGQQVKVTSVYPPKENLPWSPADAFTWS